MIPTSVWPASSRAARIAADLAVHHAARPDQVRARLGLRDRDPPVALERRVVVDLAAVGVEHAAVAVVGVLVQAQVAHDDRVVAELVAQRADRPLRDAVGVPRLGAFGVLARRDPEQHERPHARRRRSRGLLAERLDRVLELAGHRRDRRRLGDALLHEQRRDQVGGVEAVSRTSARRAAVRRRRRGRCCGKLMAAA